jgi:GNAT superfamily N-acetyltransferase
MIVIRRGDRLDVTFLRSLLVHAYSRRVSSLDIDVPTSCYVDNWGRPGDVASIAMDEGHSVGAGWFRLFSEGMHGYGFVDAQTPELTVAVVPSRQGEGIGQELLAALLIRAVDDGYPGLSASVEADFPERESLLEQGFRVVAVEGSTLTMYRPLSAGEDRRVSSASGGSVSLAGGDLS